MHAVKKLRVEGLKKRGVEDYTMKGRPLPGCFVLGFIGSVPVHSAIAIDRDFDRIFVITVYKPSLERWENDWKTRKTKD